MAFKKGDRVQVHFPDDDENAGMNGSRGVIVGSHGMLPSGYLHSVKMDDWSFATPLGMNGNHLIPEEH